MSYYYAYPYPYIHPVPLPQYYIPAPVYPTTITYTVPIIQQTPGFNTLHGHDPGAAPPGLGNRVAGVASTSMCMYYSPVGL